VLLLLHAYVFHLLLPSAGNSKGA